MPTAAPRWILHVDLDQFLASVELLRHPELAGLPVIVGGNGDPTEPRKVVTCASYEARAYGVRAGMPLRTAARRCPEATFLPSNPAAYNAASEEVVALLRDLGYPVEVWGWDEAYLAVAPGTPDDPIEVAEEIRKVILSQTGLSCSIGISDNKQRAKIATGLAKPAGIYQLTDANWMAIMGDRTVEALWGVGPKTTKRLAKLGINTVYQLAHTDSGLMTDTGFYVSADAQRRAATMYRLDEQDRLRHDVMGPPHVTPPSFCNAGGGLWSTADDYLRFVRMLLGDGTVDGVRVLSPESVRLMRTDRLTDEQKRHSFLGAPFWVGRGFGLNLSVVTDPAKSRPLFGPGGLGTFSWPGAYGTWWQADPSADLILLYLIQHCPDLSVDAAAAVAGNPSLAKLRTAQPKFVRRTYRALGL